MKNPGKMAQNIRKASFWIGIAMAGAIPLTPVVYYWLHPARKTTLEPDLPGLASYFLAILGEMGDGILAMVWMIGFAVVAVIASLVALVAAWKSGESRRTKIICLLPILIVALAFVVLIALDV